ncbi:MAG: hypothetical protein RLT87_00740 [Gammaproteobacteria bacterium]
MDDKSEFISNQLKSAFKDGEIEYLFAGDLHKFRINHKGPTHWLIIDQVTMEDHDIDGLQNLIETYHVIDTFMKAEGTYRILLTPNGIKNVESPDA